MIGYISGKLVATTDLAALIDVNGVGYEVFLPKTSLVNFCTLGETVTLFIHTHVSQDALQLFGFASQKEKRVFEKLISVSGIGPKLGLKMLSDISINDLLTAILKKDTLTLTKINGIGKKTAERLVLELKDKFENEPVTWQDLRTQANQEAVDLRMNDALSALVNLGYPENHMRRVMTKIAISQEDTIQTLIKKSLAQIKIAD